MRLKQRPGDFHVRELLNENFLQSKGDYAVYRITKKKMTTPEAVKALATAAGLETGDIKFAGLKDRQAVTTQYMSVPRKHREVKLNEGDLPGAGKVYRKLKELAPQSEEVIEARELIKAAVIKKK